MRDLIVIKMTKVSEKRPTCHHDLLDDLDLVRRGFCLKALLMRKEVVQLCDVMPSSSFIDRGIM